MKIWAVEAEVGEGPFWDEVTGSLFWIDVRKPSLHQYSGEGVKLCSWVLPEPVGAFALLEDRAKALVALASGLALLDLPSGQVKNLVDPEPGQHHNRLNEGKVSPCGRHFVFGSMDDRDAKEATGALYCLSADRSIKVLATGLVVANGIAWSLDGGTLYFSDSRASTIWVSDWDSTTGTIANRRIFASPTAEQGRPDGAAMDEEGHYWSAGVSAGRLNRFAPDGNITETIDLPVQAPTMPAFGPAGSGLMFVTSHRRIEEPTAMDGSIVVLNVGQRGLPQRRFQLQR
ncbi:SMP-30/gluconolactonase/LRE family protein [Microvirga ossetica]|uniref:SMP-30/gluconolactonase/LRE family protein n=1 Tax=Microvirga ossetica TaxID=1882682 RepID=UPI0013000F80|nr:SMP-30/gluconolactonase/LRE family protein [Microvirga ossetica]